MARLMSQIKGGYYAAAPAAVAAVLERLRPPSSGECVILDPCGGEGHALLQLAQGLRATAYGIELSEDRAALVRDSCPRANRWPRPTSCAVRSATARSPAFG